MPQSVEKNYKELAKAEPNKPDPQTSAADKGGVVPAFRSAPRYPREALAKRLSGCVVLNFSISESGRVEDARAVLSSDEVFEQPALDALSQWRYVPRFERDLPIRTDGVSTVIRFSLEGRRSNREFEKCDEKLRENSTQPSQTAK